MSTKMNPDVKAKWVSALRSGEYKKINGALAKKNTAGEMCFCALGVLCDMNARATGQAWDEGTGRYSYLGNASHLPTQVQTWAGLVTKDPVIYGSVKRVSNVNDGGSLSGNHSFNQIADLIEKNL